MTSPGGLNSIAARWTKRSIAPFEQNNPFSGLREHSLLASLDVFGIGCVLFDWRPAARREYAACAGRTHPMK